MNRGGPERVPDGVRPVEATRWREGRGEESADRVAHEEPLEIQVNGAPLAVVMRTPGADLELATGFLLTERVIEDASDLESLRHCSEASTHEASDNVVRATLVPGVTFDLESVRRNLFATSSCGVCGKATLASALATAPPLDDPARFPAAFFYGLPERLRAAQPLFDETGGLHAAAVFDPTGELLVAREDVGRHNAVDKVVGFAARAGRLPPAGHVLLVSGRVSFEIVQKALAARLPVVAAVSAPSSLAIELASAGKLALVAFLRGRSFRAYGARGRIVHQAGETEWAS
jgi:FdhD protein